jgi:biofilm protein TabA
MILDTLENASLYTGCHPLFARAFEFLRSAGNGDGLAECKTEIDGKQLFVMKVESPGKGKDLAALESHRDYIDIQYTAKGSDVIGWSPLASPEIQATGRGFNAEKDIEFYNATPKQWVDVPAGSFAIFFPGDVHAPLGTTEPVTKLVVKVRI